MERKGSDYWKQYREELTNKLLDQPAPKQYDSKQERGVAIYEMAMISGIKPTARSFGVAPKTVRYWVKKFKSND